MSETKRRKLHTPEFKAKLGLEKWPHLLRQEVGAAKVDSLKG